MKFIFAFLAFVNVVLEASEPDILNVTVFYESLCRKSMMFFKTQLWPAYQDRKIYNEVNIELIPFGRAEYTTNPWTIICHHGPRECFGNALQACFMLKNPDNYDQVAFASCCMTERDPPGYGELCSNVMGSDYNDLKKCVKSPEGIHAQVSYGERTSKYINEFQSLPAVMYNDKYDKNDCKDSLKDLKKVIRRKLSEEKVKKKIKDKEEEKQQ